MESKNDSGKGLFLFLRDTDLKVALILRGEGDIDVNSQSVERVVNIMTTSLHQFYRCLVTPSLERAFLEFLLYADIVAKDVAILRLVCPQMWLLFYSSIQPTSKCQVRIK